MTALGWPCYCVGMAIDKFPTDDEGCATANPPAETSFPRIITGHEGSTLNNAISINSDERDESGGAHRYVARIDNPPHLMPSVCCYVQFQKGPLKEAGLNGISDEALLAIVVDRLEGFNEGKYRCRENSLAITHIQEALHWLQHRTNSRQRRGVEGTHQV